MWTKYCLSIIATMLMSSDWAQAADLYGGDDSISREATGFFRLEEVDGRHFFITPEGHGFRALGLNHFHMIKSRDYEQAIQNLRAWGFNSGGYQAPAWQWNRVPHTRGIVLVPVSNWMTAGKFAFRDVFEPEFLNQLEQNIRGVVEPSKDNPFLVGYFWTDIPLWSAKRQSRTAVGDIFWGQDWISFYKALPENAAGKKVWEDWRRENPDAAENAFLAVIARQLYNHAHAVTRKYDANHLIMGDRYFEPDMPEQVIREALPFIDVLAIQPTAKKFDPEYFTRLSARYGKPVYIADHVTSFRTEEHPNTMSQVCTDPESYVDYYTQYVTSALSHPAVVGYNKCQYQDQLLSPDFLKQGLLKLDGTLQPTVDGIKAANRKALESAYSF
jgi:hypothetical protein